MIPPSPPPAAPAPAPRRRHCHRPSKPQMVSQQRQRRQQFHNDDGDGRRQEEWDEGNNNNHAVAAILAGTAAAAAAAMTNDTNYCCDGSIHNNSISNSNIHSRNFYDGRRQQQQQPFFTTTTPEEEAAAFQVYAEKARAGAVAAHAYFFGNDDPFVRANGDFVLSNRMAEAEAAAASGRGGRGDNNNNDGMMSSSARQHYSTAFRPHQQDLSFYDPYHRHHQRHPCEYGGHITAHPFHLQQQQYHQQQYKSCGATQHFHSNHFGLHEACCHNNPPQLRPRLEPFDDRHYYSVAVSATAAAHASLLAEQSSKKKKNDVTKPKPDKRVSFDDANIRYFSVAGQEQWRGVDMDQLWYSKEETKSFYDEVVSTITKILYRQDLVDVEDEDRNVFIEKDMYTTARGAECRVPKNLTRRRKVRQEAMKSVMERQKWAKETKEKRIELQKKVSVAATPKGVGEDGHAVLADIGSPTSAGAVVLDSADDSDLLWLEIANSYLPLSRKATDVALLLARQDRISANKIHNEWCTWDYNHSKSSICWKGGAFEKNLRSF